MLLQDQADSLVRIHVLINVQDTQADSFFHTTGNAEQCARHEKKICEFLMLGSSGKEQDGLDLSQVANLMSLDAIKISALGNVSAMRIVSMGSHCSSSRGSGPDDIELFGAVYVRRVVFACRIHVLINVQDTQCTFFSYYRNAEQCARHEKKICEFLMLGSSGKEQDGLDLSQVANLMSLDAIKICMLLHYEDSLNGLTLFFESRLWTNDIELFGAVYVRRVVFACRIHVLINVQDTQADSFFHTTGNAEQCARHEKKICEFLMLGSSGKEQDGLDLSQVANLMSLDAIKICMLLQYAA
ncbi:hypothetical protein Nepgr_023410 [Nepenthes gracilis]|uniref:Uncharacterized protein n=1 Tax=Nepenthes gracilis TaxID=150966 RepID=A0AAD3XXV1_NEPGR|nr:hypothetical protein Nepgr_023410 [Nepenthes gracilis]